MPDASKQCRNSGRRWRWLAVAGVMAGALVTGAGAEPIEILYERTGGDAPQQPVWGWFALAMMAVLVAALGVFYRYHRNRMNACRQQLDQARAQLREAQRIARIGSWSRNFETGEIFWSEEACRLLGLDGREGLFGHYERLIHPDDLERVTEVIAAAYHQGGSYQCDHRVLVPEGGERHVRLSGQVFVGDDGAPVRETGTIQDITGQQLAYSFNQGSQQRLRTILDAMPLPVLILENVDAWPVLFANRSAYALLGLDAATPVDDIRLPSFWVENAGMDGFVAGLHDSAATVSRECLLRDTGGREFWADVTGRRLELAGVAALCVCIADITERRHAQRELERLATTDPLTGCLNRRSFLDGMQRELRRSIRYQHLFSLLIMDIDHFKRVNDRYGHGLGDEVIRRFCDVVRGCLREEDLLGRLGGEEFAVVLVAAEQDGGYLVAERIRRRWQEESFEWQGMHSNFTVSIGVAQLQSDQDKVEEVLERADKGLASAKRAGRNCVIVHNGEAVGGSGQSRSGSGAEGGLNG